MFPFPDNNGELSYYEEELLDYEGTTPECDVMLYLWDIEGALTQTELTHYLKHLEDCLSCQESIKDLKTKQQHLQIVSPEERKKLLDEIFGLPGQRDEIIDLVF